MATTVHPLQIRCIAHLPNLARSQCCDLKIETSNGKRWWLCRLPAGRTDHRIVIEKYTCNTWQTANVFTDKEEQ